MARKLSEMTGQRTRPSVSTAQARLQIQVCMEVHFDPETAIGWLQSSWPGHVLHTDFMSRNCSNADPCWSSPYLESIGQKRGRMIDSHWNARPENNLILETITEP